MEDKESREEWLMRVGRELEEKVDSGERLSKEEGEIFGEYILSLRKRRLEKFGKTPELYRQILRLYGLEIPVYVVPERILDLLGEPSTHSSYILYNTHVFDRPPKAEAIVIKETPSTYKGSEIKELLYWIARILYDRVMWGHAQQETRRLVRDEGWTLQEAGERVIAMRELMIGRWVREQYSALRRFLNTKATGWKRGLTFEEVSRRFKPDIDAWRDFFRGAGRVPEDPADRGGESPPAVEGGDGNA